MGESKKDLETIRIIGSNVLNCHHVWRSLHPTLDICSNLVKKKKNKKKAIYLLLFFRNFYLKTCYFFPFEFYFKEMQLTRTSLVIWPVILLHIHPVILPVISLVIWPVIYPLSAWLSVVIHAVICLVLCPVMWCFPVLQPCFIRLSDGGLQCEIIRTFLF